MKKEGMGETHILYLTDIKKIQPQLDSLSIIPKSLAEKTETIVFKQEGKTLSLLTTNNNPQLYHQMIDKLDAQGYDIETYYTDNQAFSHAFNRYKLLEKKQYEEASEKETRNNARGDDAIILIKDAYKHIERYNEGNFIKEILKLSYQAWASDVHFQSEEIGVVMRLRIDGVLQTIIVFPHKQFKKYLMKFKYIAKVKMNIDKTSQDGRFDFSIQQNNETIKIDVRVSVLPWIRWESLVLRFLDATKGIMSFEKLWCESYHIDMLKEELNKNYGLILLTWPTWSGKTTSVYSLLNYINKPSKKIITVEDPVEYELPGIEQSQVDEKAGYTFEGALKGILRHDPDIIMVWEIRTLETANMVVNAALTWHLVISTLHTNTAAQAITRLLNMGVKPFMLASSLNLIIGQRLLRKIARPRIIKAPSYIDTDIKHTLQKIQQHYPKIHINYDGKVYQADKRTSRINDGYKGRLWVYEMLQVDATIKEAILTNASTAKIFDLAQKAWFLTMKDNAYLEMLQWETSLEEIERVLS